MVRRHFRLENRRTSICLHPEEWSMFDLVAKRLGYDVKALINEIDRTRASSSVPSAMRVFMLGYWRDLARMNAGRAAQASASAKSSSVMTASTPQPMRLAARAGSFTV
ncbi:ribbon-helix-helix domain-containing protein [Nisaea sp.]|uniref:ribbon-helix-helix domain-containing protein n=1 Tax=Nisaea sp. TaxID=2024842 RepID=UPI0032F027A2